MRTRKNYRLPERTQRRILWLSERLKLGSETRVLEEAVDRLYDQVRGGLRAGLVPRPGEMFSFVIDGVPLMDMPRSAFPRMGEHLEQLLDPRGADPKLFGLAVLAAASSGDPLVVYAENIRRVLGPELDERSVDGA